MCQVSGLGSGVLGRVWGYGNCWDDGRLMKEYLPRVSPLHPDRAAPGAVEVLASILGAAGIGQVHDDHTLIVDGQELEVVEGAVDNLHIADHTRRLRFGKDAAAAADFVEVVAEQCFDRGEVAALLRGHEFLFQVNQVRLKVLAHSNLHG